MMSGLWGACVARVEELLSAGELALSWSCNTYTLKLLAMKILKQNMPFTRQTYLLGEPLLYDEPAEPYEWAVVPSLPRQTFSGHI